VRHQEVQDEAACPCAWLVIRCKADEFAKKLSNWASLTSASLKFAFVRIGEEPKSPRLETNCQAKVPSDQAGCLGMGKVEPSLP
jgi:hypothetical protein